MHVYLCVTLVCMLCVAMFLSDVLMWHLAGVYVLGMSLLNNVCVWVCVSLLSICTCIYARLNIFECVSGYRHEESLFFRFFFFK